MMVYSNISFSGPCFAVSPFVLRSVPNYSQDLVPLSLESFYNTINRNYKYFMLHKDPTGYYARKFSFKCYKLLMCFVAYKGVLLVAWTADGRKLAWF